MIELNVPFSEFLNIVQFRSKGFETEAYVLDRNGEERLLGFCQNQHPKAVEQWKAALFIELAQFSTTVELKTRCGCTRMMEEDQRTREIIIPLIPLMPTFRMAEIEFESARYSRRIFKYDHHLSSDGFRLFQEIE